MRRAASRGKFIGEPCTRRVDSIANMRGAGKSGLVASTIRKFEICSCRFASLPRRRPECHGPGRGQLHHSAKGRACKKECCRREFKPLSQWIGSWGLPVLRVRFHYACTAREHRATPELGGIQLSAARLRRSYMPLHGTGMSARDSAMMAGYPAGTGLSPVADHIRVDQGAFP